MYIKKTIVIAIKSSLYIVITTTIVYILIAPLFIEMNNNTLGERANFVVGDQTHIQQLIETQCKSPCPSSVENVHRNVYVENKVNK